MTMKRAKDVLLHLKNLSEADIQADIQNAADVLGDIQDSALAFADPNQDICLFHGPFTYVGPWRS